MVVKGAAEIASGKYVSGDFFQGLAVSPAAGRLIVDGDDRPGALPVAVVSMAYSQRRFGGAANAAGQVILVNNLAVTVVGVAPPDSPASIPVRFHTSTFRCTPVSSSTRMTTRGSSIRIITGSR
ncbi:MAG: ABC transporter permease [Acidobacteriota bacterium]